ncbi:MAG: rhodanese-like domain-containing protein [Thermodesulfobacteriota bacterium]
MSLPGGGPEACDEEQQLVGGPVRPLTPEALHCLLRYDDLPQDRQSGVVLADVRRPDPQGRARIPGSLQIPLYAVRTKGFLRSTTVVLIGEGHDDGPLLEECARLGGAGFAQVRVLEGGINHWWERGGPIEGDPEALAGLSRVTPAELESALRTGEWRVAGFRVEAKDLALAPVGPAVLLPDPAAGEEFVSAVRALQKRLPAGKGRLARLLLFDRKGDDCPQAEGVLRHAREAGQDLGTVFYLDGGLDAYERYQALQSNRATVGQIPSTVRQGRCGSCP